MTDSFAAARQQMTYQQMRAASVLTDVELGVLSRLQREDFTPAAWRALAYADTAVPLAHGQHMLPPTLVGRIIDAVDPRPRERVLEIGTGSGYLSACLAMLAGSVHSIEIYDDLAAAARSHLRAAGIGNVEVENADAFTLTAGTPAYDIVVLTGSLPLYDARFEAHLKPGGRLFAIVGEAPVMEARLVRLSTEGARQDISLFETLSDPLLNAPQVVRFDF
ncbi:MAG: protein-L-isoaspartate O-methyltransferase [Steroidobacteraceae bacterium]